MNILEMRIAMRILNGITVCLLCLLLGACSGDEQEDITLEPVPTLNGAEVIQKESNEKEITLTAVGDILIHDRVYNDAETKKGYQFTPMLTNVEKYLNDSTITFANQETMIGGKEMGLSGYPAFNSPEEVGDALKEVGVDIVSVANNHTLDRGEKAIQHALSYWDKIGMIYTGAYKDKKDRNQIRVLDTDEGISVAFLAYTYGTNGITVPSGKEYLVNYIEKSLIKKDILEAKQQADVVVLSLHFGEEYERMPNDSQKELSQFAADQGVDIILGHHPHVLQPAEWLDRKDGGETFVIYSLGNFLSGQYEHNRRIGGILKLTIKQNLTNGEETFDVDSPQFIPTYVHDEKEQNYEVIPMYKLSEEKLKHAGKHYEEIKDHMSQWIPEMEFIEE